MTQSKTYSFKWSYLCHAHTQISTPQIRTHLRSVLLCYFLFTLLNWTALSFGWFALLCSFLNSLCQCDLFKVLLQLVVWDVKMKALLQRKTPLSTINVYDVLYFSLKAFESKQNHFRFNLISIKLRHKNNNILHHVENVFILEMWA